MNDEFEPSRLRRTLRSICTISPQTRSEELWFLAWILAWGLAFLLNRMLSEVAEAPDLLQWLLPTLTVLLAMLAFRSYYRFLIRADELTRKIQVDGVCMAFGLGLLLIITTVAFEHLGMPQLDANSIASIMAVAWAAGQIWGHWKYQ